MSKRSKNRGKRNKIAKLLAPVSSSCWKNTPKAEYSEEKKRVFVEKVEKGKKTTIPVTLVTETCTITGTTVTGRESITVWSRTNGGNWRNTRKQYRIKTVSGKSRNATGVSVRIHGEKYLRRSQSATHDTGGERVRVERKLCPPLGREVSESEMWRWYDEKTVVERMDDAEFQAYLRRVGVVK